MERREQPYGLHNGYLYRWSLKNVVKMTFAKGAPCKSRSLFNSVGRKYQKSDRFPSRHEKNEIALSQLIRDAFAVHNSSRKSVHKSDNLARYMENVI
jgi:hypothetical protein